MREYVATWTPRSYSITYDLQGGTVATANPASYTIESSAITLNNPTRTGYTFAGWTVTGLDNATKNVTISAGSTGNKTFTANWTANQYKLTFDMQGGSEVSTITQDYDTEITAPANPTKAGYEFNGWNNTIPETIPAQNMTFTAQWTPNLSHWSKTDNYTPDGTIDKPYIISSVDGWNLLAEELKSGNGYSGNVFSLGGNLEVTAMLETGTTGFAGTFEGNSKTLTVNKCFVYINHNEEFYYGTTEEAVNAIIDYCIKHGIPAPTDIEYAINGYYVKWKLGKGFSGSEKLLWKFIQKKLHEKFTEIDPDSSICQDATAMLFAPGFKNSDYVGFDLCDEITTVYSNDEIYASASEFAAKLPLNISEIAEYRKIREECEKFARKNSRSGKRPKNPPVEFPVEPEVTERAKSWVDAVADTLRDELCEGEEYRYYQYRETGKTKKTPRWLRINGEGLCRNSTRTRTVGFQRQRIIRDSEGRVM